MDVQLCFNRDGEMLKHWLELPGIDEASIKTLISAAPKAISLEYRESTAAWRREEQEEWASRPLMACWEEVNFKGVTINLTQENGTTLDRDLKLETMFLLANLPPKSPQVSISP